MAKWNLENLAHADRGIKLHEYDPVEKPEHYNELKWCGRCKRDLPKNQFAKNRAKPDGLQERCKECRAKHYKDVGYLETSRDNRLKREYGISLEDYEAMFAGQDGCCKICKTSGEDLVVDHCHETGIVRGLLCNNCNWGLGNFKDNVDFLESAEGYLLHG